ncbi:hypothetical protein FOCC_FOCC014327 [Frankliniella occidentalis]|uniref:Syntaxin-18 n=1 Tax=Frankliniella occidentalis TaxID=133901 RepID=A0A6J1SC87_FRAOC|nr:syntaxin-18 [Frankliniella occidentalis]KAE8740163.1 hypothetical protein FOCC_FOCC014327 [Frankliniella occidentalis]
MDITALFKACVKTVRVRNKALGIPPADQDKNRILNSTQTRKTVFGTKAKEIITQISKLRDFLLEHRRAYLSLTSYLSDGPQLSDSERDKIDAGAQRIMKTCSALIHDFRRQISNCEIPSQVMEHQQSVIDLLEAYLKSVCQIYSEIHMTRMKRMMDSQKMSRLEGDVNTSSLVKDGIDHRSRKMSDISLGSGTKEDSVSDKMSADEEDGIVERKQNNSENAAALAAARSAALADLAAPFAMEDDQLSAEELQMFESENAHLYNELNSLSDEVRQIERKVVKIAELQDVFTEKVLQQERDVERISSMVVGATENVRDANTQIRQAIQRNAGLRVYVLFFLLVMSFSLLFLDWYND